MGNRGTEWKRRLVVAAASLLLAAGIAVPASAEEAALEQLNEVYRLIDQYHYSDVSGEVLRDAAIRGMLDALEDPHTQYYDEEEWKELQDSFEKNYVGIGIQFIELEEGLQILKVYEHSAAAGAGLKPGDLIVGVAGKSLKTHSFEQIRDDLYGPEGSSVMLEVVKAGEKKSREVTITRKPFHIPSVEYGRLDGGAGYIFINSFSSDTAKLVGEAIDAFQKSPKVTALILDLRNNPGGYLDAVAEVAEYVIDSGTLLYMEDSSGRRQAVVIESEKAVDWPLILLVNHYSASASEILAGAVQDWERGIVIGERTYGKGSVQKLIPLQTGGGLRLTVEQYFTPDGSKVEGIGIQPDREVLTPFAQIVAALREANIEKIRAELKPYETVVNGIPFDFVVPVLREGNGVYIQARTLAEAMGGKVTWQKKTSTVTVTGLGITAEFDAAKGLLLKDGVSYIEIGAWTEAFPSWQWDAGTSSLVLEMN